MCFLFFKDVAYKYDEHEDNKKPTILADQLSGHWFLRCCGAERDAVSSIKNEAMENAMNVTLVIHYLRG